VKRGGTFGELLPRAMRGEPLHLDEGVELEFAILESARAALADQRPPDDVELEVLLALIDNHLLRGREGRLEGWHDDERQRDLLCAKCLLDAGKHAYGRQRLRDQRVELQLRTSAVRLLKQHFPQSQIERHHLHGFKKVPSAALVAYVEEHMPGAVAKMQDFARSLAGKRRAAQGHSS
jgi:hypothetical protein